MGNGQWAMDKIEGKKIRKIGVMDKKNGFLSTVLASGQKEWCLFSNFD